MLGQPHGNGRRYDGPFGKSDRAFVFGALAVWIALEGTLPSWAFWLQPILCLALVLTCMNRIRAGLKPSMP